MAQLVMFLSVVGLTAALAAAWIYALVTGRFALIGPLIGVSRATRPVSYVVLLAVFLLSVAFGVGASAVAGKHAFPLQHIPGPPAAGYAEPSKTKVPERANAALGYFPASLMRTTYTCRENGNAPVLDDWEVAWYSRHLAAAGEPSLLEAVKQGTPRRDVYRFTWLRSFEKPIIIRIERAKSGALLMTASRLSGMGGYVPGSIEARISKDLSQDEAHQFRRALSAANGLRLKAVSCRWGYDGAQWIFEGVDRGRYRYVERWTPDQGSVRALGLVMLSFTGWETEPLY
ncbi:hypothetical protein [Phenylobacterium sp.]|uniref:hypothetical protein n=1 Tax=Phenylobacterium sp. TaxID=1871053 RepID=UPI002730347B|nr:hypothetical protein [Phenylobacterium sp.]MDP1617646.1 hypothetical protein [Phenylobacterium sp.]MDP1987892.1 hypothetical protein [Phenylobacterium sp.]